MTRPIPGDLSILASFYRRWEPQEDARRQISDDLKELFSEGKGSGFNAKAMRKAFAEQYRLDHENPEQRDKREQTDEETELYLSALARVRESDTDSHAVDPEEGTPLASNGDAEMSSSDINSAEFRGLVEDVSGGPPADTNSGPGSEGLGLPDREVTVHSPAPNPSNITPIAINAAAGFVQVPHMGGVRA